MGSVFCGSAADLMCAVAGPVRDRRGVAGTLLPSRLDTLLGRDRFGLWRHNCDSQAYVYTTVHF